MLGKTQAEVKEKLTAAMDDAKDLDVARSDDYTNGTWLTNWYTLYDKPNVRVSIAEYYRRSIELHVNPRIGDIKLNKLTGRDLQKLYQNLRENGRLREIQKEKSPGLSASTVRGIHLMLPFPGQRPYAPECNPDEHLNHGLKLSVHSGELPFTSDDIVHKMRSYLSALQHDPKRLLRFFSIRTFPIVLWRSNSS